MRISIVLATQNRAQQLRQTLQALFLTAPSAHYDFEVIVVDCDSVDDTPAVVADLNERLPNCFYGKLRYCFTESATAAFQSGMQFTRGDIVVLANERVQVSRALLDEISRQHRHLTAPSPFVLNLSTAQKLIA